MLRSAWNIGDKWHVQVPRTREMWKPTLAIRRDQTISEGDSRNGPGNLKLAHWWSGTYISLMLFMGNNPECI